MATPTLSAVRSPLNRKEAALAKLDGGSGPASGPTTWKAWLARDLALTARLEAYKPPVVTPQPPPPPSGEGGGTPGPTPTPAPANADVVPVLELLPTEFPPGQGEIYVTLRLVDPNTGFPAKAVRNTWQFQVWTGNGTNTYENGQFVGLRQWVFFRPGDDTTKQVVVKNKGMTDGMNFIVAAIVNENNGYWVRGKVQTVTCKTGAVNPKLAFKERAELVCPTLDPAKKLYDAKFDASFVANDAGMANGVPVMQDRLAHGKEQGSGNQEIGYYENGGWQIVNGKLRIIAKRLAQRFFVPGTQRYYDFHASLLNTHTIKSANFDYGAYEVITSHHPTQRGMWPALTWTMPEDGSRFTEEDQHENWIEGSFTPSDWCVSYHSEDPADFNNIVKTTIKLDLSAFWPNVNVCIDRIRQVYVRTPTLSTLWLGRWDGTKFDMHEVYQTITTTKGKRQYLLFGLAVGGGAGPPDASFQSDYIEYEAIRTYRA